MWMNLRNCYLAIEWNSRIVTSVKLARVTAKTKTEKEHQTEFLLNLVFYSKIDIFAFLTEDSNSH